MRKRMLALTAAAVLILTAACGKTVSVSDDVVTSVSSQPVSENMDNQTSVSNGDNAEGSGEDGAGAADYTDVLNAIYESLYDIDYIAACGLKEYYSLEEYAFYNSREASAYQTIGYTTEDLNGDGVDELLVVGDDDLDGMGKDVLLVFVYVDGAPVLVKQGYVNATYRLTQDMHIIESGSTAENAASCFGEYAVESGSDKLKVVNFYFMVTDEEGRATVYENYDGSDEIADSYVVEKGADEFLDDIGTKFGEAVEIPVSSFAGYNYTGNNDIRMREAANVTVDYYEPEGPYLPAYADFDAGENSSFTDLILSADSQISNVTVWKVADFNVDESGQAVFFFIESGHMGFETYEDSKTVEPGDDLIMKLAFQSDLPEYAVSYRDYNGDFKRFLVYQSGFDGSICMEYVD